MLYFFGLKYKRMGLSALREVRRIILQQKNVEVVL